MHLLLWPCQQAVLSFNFRSSPSRYTYEIYLKQISPSHILYDSPQTPPPLEALLGGMPLPVFPEHLALASSFISPCSTVDADLLVCSPQRHSERLEACLSSLYLQHLVPHPSHFKYSNVWWPTDWTNESIHRWTIFRRIEWWMMKRHDAVVAPKLNK